jgi:murein DD-endopeptidase MepM/ murein hydrolase activator NlpD
MLSAAPVAGAGNYVFPVGGGPGVVSVSHYHHDYPAADIAAPEGSPLYALSDGTVLYAWSWDERCGTGFTMQTTDGQTWTYCHLSYLEPTVTQGAQLTAGDPVGLVGSTGDATGPLLQARIRRTSRGSRASPTPPSGGPTAGRRRRARTSRWSSTSSARRSEHGSSFGPFSPMKSQE